MSNDWHATVSDFSSRNYQRQVDAANAEARRAQSALRQAERELQENERRVDRLARQMAEGQAEMEELGYTIADLGAQQNADRRRIEQNDAMITNLRAGLEEQSEELASVNQQVAVLEQESTLARQRIDLNTRQIGQLEQGVAQINAQLEAERAALAQDRRSQEADVQAQTELAALLRNSLDPARVQQFGYESAYTTALTTLAHAEESTRLGRLEAARATYQEAQRAFVQVARDVGTREREYNRYRHRCQATLKHLETELARAETDDMLFWHRADYRALQARVHALTQRVERGEFDQAGRPEQVITALEQLTNEVAARQQEVSTLERQLITTIQQAQTRVEIMQKMMSSLMEVWGDNQFAISYGYEDKEDPKTTLKVQTVRPNRPNVTLYMELDGAFQFSWTGYPGMECARDIDQFTAKLKSQHQLSLAVSSSTPKPGQSNPDLGPQGPGVMTLVEMEQKGTVDKAYQRG